MKRLAGIAIAPAGLVALTVVCGLGLGGAGEAVSQGLGTTDFVPAPVETGEPPPAGQATSPGGSGSQDSLEGVRDGGRASSASSSAGVIGSSPADDAPGRRHSPLPAAPVEPGPKPLLGSDNAVILQRFECPREAIRRMLESAVTAGEFSASLALEREVIELCRDRQSVLAEIVESERVLAEVLEKDRAARAAAAVELEALREAKQLELAGVRAALVREQEAAEAARRVADAPPPVAPAPEYGWFSVFGRGDDLRAGVTDGETRRFVRVGDSLPGGLVIEEIEAGPGGVRVSGGSADWLPYRGRGGG